MKSQEEIAKFLAESYATCTEIEELADRDITSLLKYQTSLMAMLARSAEIFADANYHLSVARGKAANLHPVIKYSELKIHIERDTALEQRVFDLSERLNRTITHLLDSLNVKIPAERRLMPNQR